MIISKTDSEIFYRSEFNHIAANTSPLGVDSPSSPLKMALYFPRPEIVPNVRQGTYRFTYSREGSLSSCESPWNLPHDDCRAIVESQLLSLRLRSRHIVASPSPNPENLPPQPRRIYLVGGGSQNAAIAQLVGEILGGVEGGELCFRSQLALFWGYNSSRRTCRGSKLLLRLVS